MTESVQSHYTRGNLLDSILAALVTAGHEPDALSDDALAPAEEFHTLGRVATIALAEAAGITGTDRVLDVGSGIGGPARLLARRYGCSVHGIDLTDELCQTAIDLNRRVGLADMVTIRQGDALDLPYEDASFDVVWTQHVSMNIADKDNLFREMRRVTADNGRLAFFDILAGPKQPIHFPVPWANDESVSFLASVSETRERLGASGFEIQTWHDLTEEAMEFYSTLSQAPPATSPLGLQLLIPDMPAKAANLQRNASEERIKVVRCVAVAR